MCPVDDSSSILGNATIGCGCGCGRLWQYLEGGHGKYIFHATFLDKICDTGQLMLPPGSTVTIEQI